VATIDARGLQHLVNARDRGSPPVGGVTQAHADQHFAQAFDGSVARTELAFLDPLGAVGHVSNAFIRVLAGNNICLVDAPCGAGAASFAFLTSVCELRAQGVLPRHPLNVHLIGAEISGPSRLYAADIFSAIRTDLEEQAIFVNHALRTWDVTDQLSNTDLIRDMTVASQNGVPRLLVVANFNAFLQRDRRRNDAEPQLQELFRHASGDRSVVIWIEPAMNHAVGQGGLFSWVRGLVRGAWRLFAREELPAPNTTDYPRSEAKFQDPLDASMTPTVRLAVINLLLERA
jgi:hypothetical protein